MMQGTYDLSGLQKLKIGLSPEQERQLLDRARKMFDGLVQERKYYEPDWKTLGSFFIPHLVRVDDTTRTQRSKWNNIINNTCRQAVKTMAAGMQSGLTSPARPWLRIGMEDQDMMEAQSVREWSQTVSTRMLNLLRRTNFYNSSSMLWTVLGSIGTAGHLQLPDDDDVFCFKQMMTGRYWIGNDHRGRVDKVFYINYLTVQQRIEMFGDRADAKTKLAWDRGDYFEVDMVRCGIWRNPFAKWDQTGTKIIASNEKPWIAVWYVDGHPMPLKTAGFDRFPGQFPRWETTDDEAYGIGCGHDAIGDTKASQLKEKEKAKGIMKMITPPLSAPQEMRNGMYPVQGVPGGVTYRPQSSKADDIQPLYQVNLPLQYLYQDIQMDEARINRAFYADLFVMLANAPTTGTKMTAAEVGVRQEEKLIQLGPVIERVNNEFLDPLVERTFEMMFNRGMLPPPPPEIEGMPLKIEYISPLAQAQQMVGLGNIERFMSFAGQAAQFFPEVRDKVNADQSIDEVGNALGVPVGIIASDEQAQQKRDTRAQIQQAQQMTASMPAMAKAAKDASQAKVGDRNLLETVAGQ